MTLNILNQLFPRINILLAPYPQLNESHEDVHVLRGRLRRVLAQEGQDVRLRSGERRWIPDLFFFKRLTISDPLLQPTNKNDL